MTEFSLKKRIAYGSILLAAGLLGFTSTFLLAESIGSSASLSWAILVSGLYVLTLGWLPAGDGLYLNGHEVRT